MRARVSRRRSRFPFAGRPLALLLALLLALPAALLLLPPGGPEPAQAAPSSAPLWDAWVTNGPVYSILPAGNVTYIGGDFTHVGPHTGGGVPLSASSGRPLAAFPKVRGSVYAAVPDGSGGWFIGGLFTQVGEAPRDNIAHVLPDGGVSDWSPDANGTVLALALSGSTIYVGGWFSNIGGQDRNRIAALSVSTGAANTWNPDANGAVWALAVSGTTVYAGGAFTRIGGPVRNRIAAIDADPASANYGKATDWNPNANNSVFALAVSGTTVYAGGAFLSIGGQARNRGAALDATSNTNNATAWNPDANDNIMDLALSGSTVYAGGFFTAVNQGTTPQTRNRLAAFNNTDGTATAWNPNADGNVRALAVSGSTVYAGGEFSSIGGAARNRIAALSTSTGAATAWDPCAGGNVRALAVSGSTVYAGGEFSSIGGAARNYIAAIDTDPASPAFGQATAWDPDAENTVYAMARSGNTVYAGGEFSSIGGAARNYIAALSTSNGAATAWNPDLNGSASCLALSGSTVYAGGAFTAVNQGTTPQTRNRLAAFNNTNGAATAWNPDLNDSVSCLALSGSTVYAGGAFTTVNQGTTPQTRNRIAAFNNTNGAATAWNPGADASVNSLVPSGSIIYAGGAFTTIGGKSRSRIAALDATSNTNNATAWNPGASATVYTLALSGDTLYVGGGFSTMGGQPRGYMGAVSTSTGAVTAWDPSAYNNVWSLAVSDTYVCAGGEFEELGPEVERHPYLAVFASPPAVTSVTPSSGANAGAVGVADLAGTGFRYGAAVSLRKASRPYINASNVTVVSGTRITCTFDLSGAQPGAWDVVVTNPDGQSGILAGGFRVEPAVWYLAEGCTEGGMETWVLVQNPGNDPLICDLVLQTSSGEQRPGPLQDQEIPAGSRRSFNLGEHWTDWNVSTKVEASGPVICERAMYGPGRVWAHDSVGYSP